MFVQSHANITTYPDHDMHEPAQYLNAARHYSVCDQSHALILSNPSSLRYRLSDSIWSQCRPTSSMAVQPVSTSNKRPRGLNISEFHRNLPGSSNLSAAPSQHQATTSSPDITSSHQALDQSTTVSEGFEGHAQERQESDALDQASAPVGRLSSAVVLESPLDSRIQQAVALALDPVSSYWPDHCYGEDSTPFFSYLYPLVSAYLSSAFLLNAFFARNWRDVEPRKSNIRKIAPENAQT